MPTPIVITIGDLELNGEFNDTPAGQAAAEAPGVEGVSQSATAEDLMKHCETRLAKYKWPLEIEFRAELPKTNVGKILKKNLRS